MENIRLKIAEEIEKSKEEQIKFLQRLVQAPSSNPYVSNPLKSSPYDPVEKEVAGLIYQKLQEIDLSPKYEGVSLNRPNVVAEFGEGKTLIFNGHMDTIIPPPGYSFNPYSGFIDKGRLWGVGALDMKSPLCAYIYAAKVLLKFKDKLSGKLSLQFVVDEEPMAASYFGTHFLLEKGYTGNAAIVGEPGAHKITIGNRGGYRFKIEVLGEAVHTGSREWEQKKKGLNAIQQMTRVIEALSNFKFPSQEHPIFPGRKNVFTFPTEISGGEAINVVPDSCVAFGDMRILPGIDKNFIESQIKKKLDEVGINYKLTTIVYVPPTVINKKEPLVQILNKNIKEIIQREPLIEGSGPWSDMWMFVEKGIPAVNFGCKGGGIHGKDEYAEIESLIDITKIYALTAFEFLN